MQESGSNKVLSGRHLLKKLYKVMYSTEIMASKSAFETSEKRKMRNRDQSGKHSCFTIQMKTYQAFTKLSL